MLPIGPLMIEHRLIERMIEVMKKEIQGIVNDKDVDTLFVDKIVDFIRTYADHCHHGKEEDILFRELKNKRLSIDHKRIMEELLDEHRRGREITGRLVDANIRYLKRDKNSLNTIVECLKALVDFYPKHIEKEDKRFFIPIMDYFSQEEKDNMLQEGFEFDRTLIHKKYDKVVQHSEEKK